MSFEDIIQHYDGTDMIVPCDYETGRLYVCGTEELINYYQNKGYRAMSVPDFMETRKLKLTANTQAAPPTAALVEVFGEGVVLREMVLH